MNKVTQFEGFGCFLFRCVSHFLAVASTVTLESPGTGKACKELLAAHLNFQHHVTRAPSQNGSFPLTILSQHEPSLRFQAGLVPFPPSTNSPKHSWKDLEHPRLSCPGHVLPPTHITSTLSTTRWACGTAPARAVDNLQTYWVTYSIVLSVPLVSSVWFWAKKHQ